MSKAIRAIRSRILANEALAILLQNETGFKIRTGEGSEVDEPPYVLLWRIIDRPVYSLGAKTGMQIATIQCNCYAATKSGAYQLADAIAAVLDGMRGVVDGDIWVASLLQEDSRDSTDRNAEGADRPLAIVQTDYRLYYR